MKLWLRIAAPTMGLLAAAVVVPAALQVREHQVEEPERMRRTAAALSASTAIAAAEPLATDDTGSLNFLVVNLVHRNRELAYACVVDRDGRIVAHSDPEEDGRVPRDEASLRAAAAGGTLFQEIRSAGPGGTRVLEVAEPISLSGARLGAVRIGVSHAAYDRRLRAAYVRTLVSGGAFLIFGLVASFLLARAIARPVAAIARLTGRVSTGDLGGRAADLGAEEIRSLAGSLNDMIASLERSRREIDDKTRTLERLVSERTTALEQLEAAQDAMVRSERLAAAGELVAGVAHEMNNPLASIASAAEGLLRRASAQGSLDRDLAGAREYLEIIRDEAFRARAITRDLLDFVRKDPEQVAPVHANDLVRSVATLIKLRPRRRAFEVVLELAADDALPPVLGNLSKLRQVVFNVTDNAIDALPERDGRITWSTRFERGPDDRTAVVLSCRDNGCGIPPELKDRVFEPFFTTKEPGRGTGLGLAIGYGIVESHGGTIEVESEGEGRGTLVTVRLPATEASAVGAGGATGAGGDRGASAGASGRPPGPGLPSPADSGHAWADAGP